VGRIRVVGRVTVTDGPQKLKISVTFFI
jgi:hypothetical protein